MGQSYAIVITSWPAEEPKRDNLANEQRRQLAGT